MLLNISEQSSQTLQEQIVDQIRARILSGSLAADTPLPSIRTLAKEARVSVITVQRAYDTLLNQELVYSRRGKGFFVADLPGDDKTALATQRFDERLQTLIREAKREGLSATELEQLFKSALNSGDDNNA